MPFPRGSSTCCPKCGHSIPLTGAAKLQAEQLGVSCECSGCGHEWVYRVKADERAGPATSGGGVSPSDRTQIATHFSGPFEPTVFVVADGPASRSSLILLAQSTALNVESFECVESFLKQYDPSQPGCLLLDASASGRDLLEGQKQIVETGCAIPIIVIAEPGDIATAVEAMKNGAFDCLESTCVGNVFAETTRRAIETDRQRIHSRHSQVRIGSADEHPGETAAVPVAGHSIRRQHEPQTTAGLLAVHSQSYHRSDSDGGPQSREYFTAGDKLA